MVRTRFAPSPTGFLHVGSARTALYAWLYARRHGGKFILRIEDTDLERSTEAAVRAIFDGIKWLQLNYDEGPFYQTQRLERYHAAAKKLLDEGKAYRCYCSRERIDNLRQEQLKNREKPRYDGHCRDLNAEESDRPHVVRFRNPLEGSVVVEDQVYGTITFQNNEMDDLIILRSDKMPTYNFTVVVDDWDMQITHVIRGDDHLNNTPRQINILSALNANLPIYAHVPMILGEDGKKLSKRHGAVSVMQYRDEGFLPEALLNYLVRLGWSYGDQEIFGMDELIELFDIRDINRAPAALNPQKLIWLNQHYIKTSPVPVVANYLAWHFKDCKINTSNGPELTDIVLAQRERVKNLKEMAEKSRFFYEEPNNYETETAHKYLTHDVLAALIDIRKQFNLLDDWEEEAIHQVITQVATEHQIKLGKIAQPLRIAVTGSTISPPIDMTLKLVGKKRTIARIEKAEFFIIQQGKANVSG